MLVQARLDQAKGDAAVFDSADLTRANLIGMQAKRADFQAARMESAFFNGSDLSRANFEGCRLTGASFFGANLEGAKLECSAVQVDFRHARLRGASVWASFSGADLRGTRLQGTDLTNARDLTAEQLATAETDSATVLPVYLKPPPSP